MAAQKASAGGQKVWRLLPTRRAVNAERGFLPRRLASSAAERVRRAARPPFFIRAFSDLVEGLVGASFVCERRQRLGQHANPPTDATRRIEIGVDGPRRPRFLRLFSISTILRILVG